LLLAGIAIQAIVFAVVGFLMSIASDAQLRTITFWTLGDLKGAYWQVVAVVAPVVLLALVGLVRMAPKLNLLLLGEAEARHLGIRVERLKLSLIVLVTLSVGVSVSFFGVIGFVGLVVPHVVRLLVGADHRRLLPASALFGANLLLLADTLARSVSVQEIPVGVITSALGAPFFLYLLLQNRTRLGL